MQGTRVWSLVWEDPTRCRATKPMCHNYWAWALEPESRNYWAPEPRACAPQEKPVQWEASAPNLESIPCSLQPEKARVQQQINTTQPSQKQINTAMCTCQWINKYSSMYMSISGKGLKNLKIYIYILDTSSLSNIWLASNFPQSVGCFSFSSQWISFIE